MRAIDTNVLVRLIVRDDPKQTKRAEEFVRGGAWISHVVLAEVVWVLTSVYGLRRPALTSTIQTLLDHEVLAVQDAETVDRALLAYSANGRADFTDCLIAEIAAKAGHGPFGTYDRSLRALKNVEVL